MVGGWGGWRELERRDNQQQRTLYGSGASGEPHDYGGERNEYGRQCDCARHSILVHDFSHERRDWTSGDAAVYGDHHRTHEHERDVVG
jgi:hypothetical protein